jgi:hypothetical protein
MPKRTQKHVVQKIVLRLPDLDHAKSSVLNSLSSPRSRRNYKFAMEQFIAWYCFEPRLALNRTVVLRFRLHLEALGLAAGTINQRLAAVRRLAYEAADSGLLSPELAAGIRRVKGVKQLGCPAAAWKVGRGRLTKHPRRRYAIDPAWLWSAPSRAVGTEKRRHPSSTRTLGNRRPCRQRQSRPNSSDADLGKGCRGQVAYGRIGNDGTSIQGSESARYALGNRHLGKRRLVCSQELCSASRARSPGPS